MTAKARGSTAVLLACTAIAMSIYGYLAGILLLLPYFYARRLFYLVYKTFPRDAKALYRFLKFTYQLWMWERQKMTIPKAWMKLVQKHPDKVAFKFEQSQWTYREIEDLSNRVANYFKNERYSHGDTISLFMETKPEYIAIWLGLSKIGVVTALINSNLRKDPLIHCISVAHSKALIFGSELGGAVTDLLGSLDHLKMYKYSNNDDNDATSLDKILKQTSAEPLLDDVNAGAPKDKILYIYTSGTTGLPKAAVISNMRYLFMVNGVYNMIGLNTDDVIYNPLPLYHSAGGVLGVGQTVVNGLTVALRRKFSASNFWKDCIAFECTTAQYIGEICRYLLSVPVKPEETEHKIRLMFGNGLRPQIWKSFTERFNIKTIGEFYGSTEGNSNLANVDSKEGAIGFIPPFMGLLYPVTLIKCNEETGEPIRNSDGYCIKCRVQEPGIFIGKINPKKTISSFLGYADKKESEKKILKDVFAKGDCYFNSGDILMKDELGYIYFKDRTGDTFRWRSENVATSEVEAVISNVAGLKDAVVYGVKVPGAEGRAGMAAIVDSNNTLDLDKLAQGIADQLPSYARPLFLRVLDEMPMTGTYKLKKREMQLDEYDIKKIKDRMYFLSNGKYIPLTEELYNKIMKGELKL